MKNLKLLERAIQISVNAHKGQVDKQGLPYIFHPLRVMETCRMSDEKIVAILHDTVEDTRITLATLAEEGYPTNILDALFLLTKIVGEDYDKYIRRIAPNPLARAVKMADLKDNLDSSRLDKVCEDDLERINKYIRSLAYLKAFTE